MNPSRNSLAFGDSLDRVVWAALRASISGQEPSACVRDDVLREAANRMRRTRVDRRRRRWRVRSGLWRDLEPRTARMPASSLTLPTIDNCRAKPELIA